MFKKIKELIKYQNHVKRLYFRKVLEKSGGEKGNLVLNHFLVFFNETRCLGNPLIKLKLSSLFGKY